MSPGPDMPQMELAASRARARGLLPQLGHALFRFRSFTPVPLLLVLVPVLWQARGLPHSVIWELSGLALCLAGQALRAWTIGIVPDGTSGQNEVLIATELNTRGPYAHTRNPLYLGNLLITLGVCAVAHHGVVLLAVALLFGLQYRAIIAAEEAFLRERFGAAFDDFCARVPRFFPRLSPGTEGPSPAWSGRRALRKEHNPAAAWMLLALLVSAFDRVRGTADLAPFLAAAGAVLLAFLGVKAWKHAWFSGGFVADLKRRFRSIAR